MATGLIYYDGFDDTTSVSHYWVLAGGGQSITTAATRLPGGSGLQIAYSTGSRIAERAIGASKQSLILGCAWRFTGILGSNNGIFGFRDLATLQIDVRFNFSTRLLSITRNGTVLATGTTQLTLNVWYYLQFKVVIDPTVGSYDLKIDGVSELTASGVNTRASANSSADHYFFGSINAATGAGDVSQFDDFYLVDGAVGTYLGDVRVDSVFPSGAGSSTQWTPSAGSNFQCVDEASPNDDTDFVSDGTVGHKDYYAHTALSGTASVFGVGAFYRHRKDDAGSRQTRANLKLSGTTSTGTTRTESTSYVSDFDHFEDKPGGTGWTISDVNSTEIGIEVVT